jgi:hypothetical protein
MTARLASHVQVSALVRRVQAEGGFAAILARGDTESGAILLICAEKGRTSGLFERLLDMDGRYHWRPTGPQDMGDQAQIDLYIQQKRRNDPDLWLVELDIANAERFIAE